MKAIHFNSNIKLVILFTFGSIYFLNAQDKLIKTPNKVTSKDFSVTTNPKVDNNSNALVLFSIGSTEFEGNTKGDFTLVYKETKRVLIKIEMHLILQLSKFQFISGDQYLKRNNLLTFKPLHII